MGQMVVEQREPGDGERYIMGADGQKFTVVAENAAVNPVARALALLGAAALLPAFAHVLWIVGQWSWGLIGS